MALRHLDPHLGVDALAAAVDASDLANLTDEDRLRPAAWRRRWDEADIVSAELHKRHERPPEADERSFRTVVDLDAVVTLDELSDAELLERLENALDCVGDIQYRYGLLLGLALGAEVRSAVNGGRDPALGLGTVLRALLDVLDAMNTADAIRELAHDETKRKWRETGTTPMLDWLREQVGDEGEAAS